MKKKIWKKLNLLTQLAWHTCEVVDCSDSVNNYCLWLCLILSEMWLLLMLWSVFAICDQLMGDAGILNSKSAGRNDRGHNQCGWQLALHSWVLVFLKLGLKIYWSHPDVKEENKKSLIWRLFCRILNFRLVLSWKRSLFLWLHMVKSKMTPQSKAFLFDKSTPSFLIWYLFTVNLWKVQIQNKIQESNASWPETIWTKRAHLGTVNFKEMSEYLWETQSVTCVVSVCNWIFSVS